MLFSITMLPPVFVGLIYGDGATYPFIAAFFVLLIVGVVLWLPVKSVKKELRLRDRIEWRSG